MDPVIYCIGGHTSTLSDNVPAGQTHLLIHSRDRGREALAGIYGYHQPNLSLTNGLRDGICCYCQQLCLSKWMGDASNYSSVSWFGPIGFTFTLVFMFLLQ